MQINPSYMRDNQTKKAQVPCTPAFFFFFFFFFFRNFDGNESYSGEAII